MRKTNPTLSIVIPAYNEEAVIEACVMAALKQTVPADEIIVVDNMSTDRTAAIVRRLQRRYPNDNIRLLSQTSAQGVVPTRNRGFDAARSHIIGRIDADSIIDEYWVAEVKQIFRDNHGLAATTGPVVYYDMPFRGALSKADNILREFIAKLAPDYLLLFGSNMAVSKVAWQAVKDKTARDEENRLHEDIDLGLCLSEAGFDLQYNPRMVGSMSARRLEDSPKDFRQYIRRFNNTFDYHGIKDSSLRTPVLLYLSIYFPGKALRRIYSKRHDIPKGPSMPA